MSDAVKTDDLKKFVKVHMVSIQFSHQWFAAKDMAVDNFTSIPVLGEM